MAVLAPELVARLEEAESGCNVSHRLRRWSLPLALALDLRPRLHDRGALAVGRFGGEPSLEHARHVSEGARNCVEVQFCNVGRLRTVRASFVSFERRARLRNPPVSSGVWPSEQAFEPCDAAKLEPSAAHFGGGRRYGEMTNFSRESIRTVNCISAIIR